MSLILNTLKNVDKSYVSLNDTITYTILISNSGSFDALNVILTDLIPQGANFISNTVFINSINALGLDPALGISIGTLPIGSVTTITMSALTVALPYNSSLNNLAQLDYEYIDISTTPNIIPVSIDTNNVTTTIQAAIITVDKSSDTPSITSSNQLIKYTLKISNIGNIPANNLFVIDSIPLGTSFIPNSISIFDITIPGTTIEPPNGYDFGSLDNGFYSELSFYVQVISIPDSQTINNQSKVNYSYTVNTPTAVTTIVQSILSNLLIIPTSLANANLTGLTKYVDKNFSTSNDTVTYTIVIPNTGTLAANDVVLIDTLPSGTTYIPNSLVINSITIASFSLPLNIGTIEINSVVTISFKVKIS